MIYELYDIIAERKRAPRDGSYTNALLATGQDRILQKLGEESIEVIIAATGQGDQRLIEEFSDLIYHSLVLLVSRDISLAQIDLELERRHAQRKEA